MRRGWVKTWTRSTGFRLSAIYAGLIVLTIAGGGIAGWFATAGLAERRITQRIELETAAISVEIAEEGLDRGAAAVAARTERPGAPEYVLLDPSGRQIAGDMVNLGREPGWHRYNLPSGTRGLEGKTHLLALTSRMPDGAMLTVADDLGAYEAARDLIFRTLAITGVVALGLGLGAGFLSTRQVLRRMAMLAATMDRVAAGSLSARVQTAGWRDDDVHALARGLNAMLDRIDRLVAAVRRVSSEVAHDLRTPLSHVRQRIEQAAQAEDAETRARALAGANEGIDAALRLFDAMLALAEIDAGAARRRFAQVDLSEIAERVADAYRPDVEQAGLALAVTVPVGAMALGEADLIAQALANLIENALKHARGARTIAIRAEREDGFWLLAVEDDGCGIGEGEVATALRPFGRLDPARSSPGFGLGLAIVDAIARAHGSVLLLAGRAPGLRASLKLEAVS